MTTGSRGWNSWWSDFFFGSPTVLRVLVQVDSTVDRSSWSSYWYWDSVFDCRTILVFPGISGDSGTKIKFCPVPSSPFCPWTRTDLDSLAILASTLNPEDWKLGRKKGHSTVLEETFQSSLWLYMFVSTPDDGGLVTGYENFPKYPNETLTVVRWYGDDSWRRRSPPLRSFWPKRSRTVQK